MLENYEVFLIGCVGAIAPEIIRLYKLRNYIKFKFSWSYIAISIAFVLLGGFISSILEPSNAYSAFYSGVGTPFIINGIIKETQPDSESSNDYFDPEDEITQTPKGIDEAKEKEILKRNINRQMSWRTFFRAL